MDTTASYRHLANEQATFRAVVFNGMTESGKIELFIFATNTDLKAKTIRRFSGRGGP